MVIPYSAGTFSIENVLFPAEKKQHEQHKQHDIILAALTMHTLFPSGKSRSPGFIQRKQHNYYVNKNKPLVSRLSVRHAFTRRSVFL
jgi:hypothetical protein